MKCSLQFELLTTYYSKLACKLSYTPDFSRKVGGKGKYVILYNEKSHLAGGDSLENLVVRYCCFALLTNSAGVMTRMSKSLNPRLSRVIITSG